jgi:hypothetical protein
MEGVLIIGGYDTVGKAVPAWLSPAAPPGAS